MRHNSGGDKANDKRVKFLSTAILYSIMPAFSFNPRLINVIAARVGGEKCILIGAHNWTGDIAYPAPSDMGVNQTFAPTLPADLGTIKEVFIEGDFTVVNTVSGGFFGQEIQLQGKLAGGAWVQLINSKCLNTILNLPYHIHASTSIGAPTVAQLASYSYRLQIISGTAAAMNGGIMMWLVYTPA